MHTLMINIKFGITPACAGNTLIHLLCLYKLEGSPPRVRGIQQEQANIVWDEGITPACAGNTAKNEA